MARMAESDRWRMWARAACVLFFVVGGCADVLVVRAPPFAPGRWRNPGDHVDIDMKNLSADEEIRELRRGLADLGSPIARPGAPGGLLLVAVIPLGRAGTDEAWLAEAVAERIAQLLAAATGVAVVERHELEGILRAPSMRLANSDAALVDAARALGVSVALGVSATRDGTIRAVVRPARSDGWSAPSVTQAFADVADAAMWAMTVELASLVGIPGRVPKPTDAPLAVGTLELVSRARTLLRADRPIDALALFEKALP